MRLDGTVLELVDILIIIKCKAETILVVLKGFYIRLQGGVHVHMPYWPVGPITISPPLY